MAHSTSLLLIVTGNRKYSAFLLSTLFTFLILTTLSRPAEARKWSSTQLPNPQNDPTSQCGRNKKSAICDPDGFLSESDADTIDGLVNFIEQGSHGFKKMQCQGGMKGAQLAVAMVEKMSLRQLSNSKSDSAVQFAKDLHDRWGVGDVNCQNGVVLFISVKDRVIGFSTGAGVKNIFTDAMIPKVIALMRPKLKEEEYGPAVIDGVTAVGNIISGGKPPSTDDEGFNAGGAIIGTLIGGGVIYSIAIGTRSQRRYNRCKKLLTKIDSDREKANDKQYIATSCPICLEDFKDKPRDDTPTPDKHSTKDERNSEHEKRPLMENETSTGQESNGKPQGVSREIATDLLGREAQSFSAENDTTSTDDSEQRVNTLPCGHMFHHSCISSWISGSRQTNSQCPVCRQPIVDSDARTTVTSRTNNGSPSGWDVYDDEYNFRMRRMRYYYDDYITWAMIDSWNRDRYSRHRHSTHSVFVAVNPQVVAEAARASGTGGSSFSFGGGSSAGGGGGGGSW